MKNFFNSKKNIIKFVNKVDNLITSKDHSIQNIFNFIIKNGKRKIIFNFDENNEDKNISYDEFEGLVKTYSEKIHSLFSNLQEGDIIILKMQNCKDWVISYFAILKAGFKPLFLNPNSTEDETISIIKETNSKGLISFTKEDCGVPSFTIEEILKCEDIIPNTYNFQDEIIFCSSGTTGKSKIFIFNGENLVANLETSKCMPLETKNILYENKNNSLKVLGLAPFFHIFGFFSILNWHLFYSSTIVFPNKLSFKNIKETVINKNVTHVYFVPLFFDNLAKELKFKIEGLSKQKRDVFYKKLEQNISKNKISFGNTNYFKKIRKDVLGNQIKYLISGGGAILDSTLKLFNGIGYVLCNGFGMTETGVTSVELSSSIKDRIKNSIGHALPPTKYTLLQSKENPSISELFVEAKTIHCKRFENGQIISNELNVYPTGDIATIDEDGRAYIKGRIKDIIISSNGENISPDEIEEYFSNIPYIEEYCVFGAKEKNSNVEKIIFSFFPKENITDDEFKKIRNQIDTLIQNIPQNKRPTEYLQIKIPFPKPNNLKISRIALKELYLNKDSYFSSIKEPRHIETYKNFSAEKINEIRNQIKNLFSSFLKIPADQIQDDSHWTNDLGGNSLNYIDLIFEIQKTFNINISQEKYGAYTTINDFLIEILNQQNKKV